MTPAPKPQQHRKSRLGVIIFAVAAASSAGAAAAGAISLDIAVGPLLGLAAHAWMGLVIWAFLRGGPTAAG